MLTVNHVRYSYPFMQNISPPFPQFLSFSSTLLLLPFFEARWTSSSQILVVIIVLSSVERGTSALQENTPPSLVPPPWPACRLSTVLLPRLVPLDVLSSLIQLLFPLIVSMEPVICLQRRHLVATLKSQWDYTRLLGPYVDDVSFSIRLAVSYNFTKFRVRQFLWGRASSMRYRLKTEVI